MEKLILASASPRRREIFNMMGLDFEVIASNSEPETNTKIDIETALLEVARAKAFDIYSKNEGRVVVGADTVVYKDGVILEKPKDKDDAFSMLKMLSGDKHSVYTAVYVFSKDGEKGFVSKSDVEFYELSDSEIENYIKTEEYKDKAGGYAIQGKAFRFVKAIYGDFYNIVGFPAAEFLRFMNF
ncbi:MAG: septum formation protein Maf [Oscillospiraceae bacterium]|nr:septum formation protein Maf [Oscillospiraceae bacterium]